MDLVLFGIQGSGKGTQAKRLAAECGYHIFEAGGELRYIAAGETDLGQTVKSYIDNGNLVPHDIIMQVVREALEKRPMDQRILFDGVPRDLDQMRDFNAVMQELGRDFRAVELKVDEAACMERILIRARQQGRADDSQEDIIRRRMQTFKEKTLPVINAYRAQGKVKDIDGEGTVEEVFGRLQGEVC